MQQASLPAAAAAAAAVVVLSLFDVGFVPLVCKRTPTGRGKRRRKTPPRQAHRQQHSRSIKHRTAEQRTSQRPLRDCQHPQRDSASNYAKRGGEERGASVLSERHHSAAHRRFCPRFLCKQADDYTQDGGMHVSRTQEARSPHSQRLEVAGNQGEQGAVEIKPFFCR